MSRTLTLPEMPFYWRTKHAPNYDIDDPPSRLPFVFTYDPSLDLIIEERSDRLAIVLKEVYRREANIGFLQDGHSLAKAYGEDFWFFLHDILSRYQVKRILEIGCGGCFLLDRLKRLAYDVLGVDPSPIAARAGKVKGIPVIEDFFPSPRINMDADLVFHVDVLEHLEDPMTFLATQLDFLRPGALLVVNVPDSTRSIALGDISIAMHQHVNMFTHVSLSRTLVCAGFEVVTVKQSGYGASIYALARKPRTPPDCPSSTDSTTFDHFTARAAANIRRFQNAVLDAFDKGETIGFFMPIRAFPYLATMHLWDGYRIFDNMNTWHRRFFDGFDGLVENQSDLFQRPPDHVFVMSLTFGNEVKNAVALGAPGTKVTILSDLVAE